MRRSKITHVCKQRRCLIDYRYGTSPAGLTRNDANTAYGTLTFPPGSDINDVLSVYLLDTAELFKTPGAQAFKALRGSQKAGRIFRVSSANQGEIEASQTRFFSFFISFFFFFYFIFFYTSCVSDKEDIELFTRQSAILKLPPSPPPTHTHPLTSLSSNSFLPLF